MNGAVIFCGGIIDNYDYLKERDFSGKFLICADGGLKHMNKLGLVPDAIIGDNDSWREDYPDCADIIMCPPEKDYTDTNLCIDYAIDKGYKEIELLGGLGGRADHEFSHYCLLAYGLEKDVRIKITNETNEIWMTNEPFSLTRGKKKYVSFFPYGGRVEGFSVRGLKYSADNIELSCSRVQATSNEFVNGECAEVRFISGTLIVMLCDDKEV